MLVGRGLAHVTPRAPGLIAARRIAADPNATFRAVSGVVMAAFVATWFSSHVNAIGDTPGADVEGGLRPGVVEVYANAAPEEDIAPLISEQAVVTRFDISNDNALVASCADLSRVLRLSCPHSGRVAPNNGTASVGLAGPLVEPGPGTASAMSNWNISGHPGPQAGKPCCGNSYRGRAYLENPWLRAWLGTSLISFDRSA
jgi:hypothetical protein